MVDLSDTSEMCGEVRDFRMTNPTELMFPLHQMDFIYFLTPDSKIDSIRES